MLLRNIRTEYNTYARQESMLGNVGIDSLILNRLLIKKHSCAIIEYAVQATKLKH